MAESEYSGRDHRFGSLYTSNICSRSENNQSRNALLSQLTTMKFQEEFASKLSFTTSSDAEPDASNQEEDSSPITETSSSLKSMALTGTLDFEKIFSVVETVLFNPSEMEEISDETETSSPESKAEVQRTRFQSKFVHDLPLYQHYCMQNVREDIERFKKSSMTGLVTPQRVHGLRDQIEKFYHPQTCSPQTAPVCLTPPPNPSPIRVTSCSTLWQDLEEVKESGLLLNLSSKEIRLHETSFELVCSEASYLRSLDIAVNHFYASTALRKTLTQMEHHILFSNIQQVMGASEKFLMDLERRLGECIFVGSQVGDVVFQHCPGFRRLYVPYVTNMMYQEALIRQLRQKNKDFQRELTKLEESPVCQRHNLKSFLVLPFQRITRIKLILEAIFKIAEPGSNLITNLEKAIQAVHEVVQECNSGVKKMKQIEELVCLEMLLDFGKVKAIPLVTSGRFLMHQGPMKQLCLESSVNSKMSFTNIYLHLLSDMLIISSKRDEQFEVLDVAEFPTHIRCEHFKAETLGLPQNSFLLHLSKRPTGPATVLVLVTDTRSAKEAWISALSSKTF